jgi:hypothetical protein
MERRVTLFGGMITFPSEPLAHIVPGEDPVVNGEPLDLRGMVGEEVEGIRVQRLAAVTPGDGLAVQVER